MRGFVVGLAVVAGTLLVPVGAAAATPAEATFKASCSGCHTIGGGKLVGPDLKGVVDRLGADAVAAMIRDPQTQRPGSVMPDLGLSETDIAALVALLSGDAAGGGTTPPPPPGAAGDADRGRNLFQGSKQFRDEGPPCLSCHSIAGIGALGGGQLGPDLTGAWEKYGRDQGIAAALATLPFPTMRPLFTDRPLTPEEQADIAAFLKRASGADRPGDAVWQLVLLGLGGAGLAVVLAFVLWPRRRLVVRRTIVNPPTTRQG